MTAPNVGTDHSWRWPLGSGPAIVREVNVFSQPDHGARRARASLQLVDELDYRDFARSPSEKMDSQVRPHSSERVAEDAHSERPSAPRLCTARPGCCRPLRTTGSPVHERAGLDRSATAETTPNEQGHPELNDR